MTTRTQWQNEVGRSWAGMAAATDRCFTALTAQLLDRLALLPGKAVLDIGCGAGELALAQARSRGDARVIGVDVSPDLLDVARRRAVGLDRLTFELADAAHWKRAGFAPDLLISRHGVMFFDDPQAAFAHLAALAAPGARLLFSCFRALHRNPWAGEVAGLFDLSPEPQGNGAFTPGPFAFADPDLVRALLLGAGWHDIGLERVDFAFLTGGGADPVEEAMQYFSHIGPAARALRDLPEDDRPAARERMRGWLAGHCEDGQVVFPAAAWIVTARKP